MKSVPIKKPYILTTILALIAICLIVPAAYWAKCQAGLNLFNSFSVHNYFPFKYLTKSDVIKSPESGIVIDETFNTRLFLFHNWSHPWTEENGKVTWGYDANGTNESGCLLIRSSSAKGWCCSSSQYIEVQEGDHFRFEGWIREQDERSHASLGITTFDKDKKVLKWGYLRVEANKVGPWCDVKETFPIKDKVHYIKIILSGHGIGEYRFDDIRLTKVPNT